MTITISLDKTLRVEAGKAGVSVSFLVSCILNDVLNNKFEASRYIPKDLTHRQVPALEMAKESVLSKLLPGKKLKKKQSERKEA